MKTLSETWFATGYIDFELKKYTLLAYLQDVNKYFNQNRLYPQLTDVIFHFNNLVAFKKNKDHLKNQFPKQLSGVDLQKLQLIYQQIIDDDELMEQLEEIINYSVAQMSTTISSGAEIYDFVEENISINPIGLLSLDNEEGYMFVKNGDEKDTLVYQYRLSIFENENEKYRSIKTEYIASWPQKISNTYSNIKTELIKNRPSLPNPATYAIEASVSFPLNETLLPVAKRSFVKFLMENN